MDWDKINEIHDSDISVKDKDIAWEREVRKELVKYCELFCDWGYCPEDYIFFEKNIYSLIDYITMRRKKNNELD